MVKYQLVNVNKDELCVGVFHNELGAISTQFSMQKTAGKATVAMYLFNVTSVNEAGVEITNPVTNETSVVAIDQITKIKKLSGGIVEVIKSEPVIKEEVVKYFMETDEPALQLVNDDLVHIFKVMTITKGMVSLSSDEITLPITELMKQTVIKLGKEK